MIDLIVELGVIFLNWGEWITFGNAIGMPE